MEVVEDSAVPVVTSLAAQMAGSPVAASIAVSPDNAELYAVTQEDVFKLIDEGENARLDWMATLRAFEDDPEIEAEFPANMSGKVTVKRSSGVFMGRPPRGRFAHVRP